MLGAGLGVALILIRIGIVRVHVIGVLMFGGFSCVLMAEKIVQTARLQRWSQRKQQRSYQVQHDHAWGYTYSGRNRCTKNPKPNDR